MAARKILSQAVFLLIVSLGINSFLVLSLPEDKKPYLRISVFPQRHASVAPSGMPLVLSCMTTYVDNTSAISDFKWIDPKGHVIPEGLSFLDLTDVTRSRSGLTLRIMSPHRVQSGQYVCSAQYNGDGVTPQTLEKSVTIRILDKPRITKFENVTTKMGNTAVFVCSAKSQPLPNITIRKVNGTNLGKRIEVKNSTEFERNSVTFTIRNVSRYDKGFYICSAEANGFYSEQQAYLEVQFAPDMRLTERYQYVPFRSGRFANITNLTCIAEANPTAAITWESQNQEIPANRQRTETYGHRTVSTLLVNLSDSSEPDSIASDDYHYTCTANNSLGEKSVNIILRKADIPGPITQIVVDRAMPTNILFRFIGPSNDGGMPVSSYVMQYSAEQDHNDSVIEWRKGSTYIVRNLSPGALYTFTAAAKNAVGIGPWKALTYRLPRDFEIVDPENKNETIVDPKNKNDTIIDPNTLITKNVDITNYHDRFEIKWKLYDDNDKLKRYFVITYYDDGGVRVEHSKGNTSFPFHNKTSSFGNY